MPAISCSAPGKIILFGEHAVVYGQPAIAVPVHQLKAHAYILANPAAPSGQIIIEAPDIALHSILADLPETHPFSVLVSLVEKHLGINAFPAVTVKITSEIPIASGLGSGTAVSVALIQALCQFVGKTIPLSEVSSIAFEVEKIYHGTPSGIDNSVVSYAKPVFYIKGKTLENLVVAKGLLFVIADTGLRTETSEVVGQVRNRRNSNPQRYERIFQQIGEITNNARQALENGEISRIGELMNANHTLLQQLDVSSEILDRFALTALNAGAKGAKLSGAGIGGNMIALVSEESAVSVQQALSQSGAVRTILTKLPGTK